jgi:hypothetical protein
MLSAKHRRAETRQRPARLPSIRRWTSIPRDPDVEMPPLPRLVAARKVGTKISGFTCRDSPSQPTEQRPPSGFTLNGPHLRRLKSPGRWCLW